MANVNWERLARATGIVFVVLAVIGFLVIGDQPKVGDSSGDIASFYTDHRSRILSAMVIFGFALLFLIWFVGAVANTLREAGATWQCVVEVYFCLTSFPPSRRQRGAILGLQFVRLKFQAGACRLRQRFADSSKRDIRSK